jgi:hypothetical protein
MNPDYTCYTGIEPWELKTIEEKIHRLKANDQEAYALILKRDADRLGGGTEITTNETWVGTLADIIESLQTNPQPSQHNYCENRNEYGQLATLDHQEIPSTTPMYEYWNETISPETSVEVYEVYTIKPVEELDDEDWEYMPKLRVHREPLPLTPEGVEAYARHEAFGTLHLKSLEVIPAQEMLTKYKHWLTQQEK